MLQKMPFAKADTIFGRFDTSEELRSFEETREVSLSDMSPEQAIAVMHERALFIDLITFYAHGLPTRESLWWAAIAQEQSGLSWSKDEWELIAKSKSWIQEPNENLRREIDCISESMQFERPIAWLGKAIFFSGAGSIGEANGPHVAPQPYLHGKMLIGAICLLPLIDIDEDEGVDESIYEKPLAYALDIANGNWPHRN